MVYKPNQNEHGPEGRRQDGAIPNAPVPYPTLGPVGALAVVIHALWLFPHARGELTLVDPLRGGPLGAARDQSRLQAPRGGNNDDNEE